MDNDVFMSYGLNLDWQINEKFFAGASLFIFDQDEGHLNVSRPDGDYTLNINGDYSFNTYNAYLGYSFTPDITLQGIYYWQDLDDDLATLLGADVPAGQSAEDSPTAWKAVLKLDQDLLKFTSLRFEYAETDNMFFGVREYYGLGTDTADVPHVLSNMPWNNETTSTIFVRADQQWNEKWSSFIRYVHADYDTNGLDDVDNWGVAVKYQYTPAIAFRLAYDYIDFGSGNGAGNYNGDDHVIQFRTTISF